MNCYNTKDKCDMKSAWKRALETKVLGPAKLTNDIDEFLYKAMKEPRVAVEIYDVARVVAIGDIHADMLAFLGVFRLAKLIDIDANWTGGSTVVVQTGDILDRGGRGVSVNTTQSPQEEIYLLQYIHYLDKAARAKGGRVISLTGNHEAEQFIKKTQSADTYETELLSKGWGGSVATKREMFKPGTNLAMYFGRFKPILLRVNSFLFCHGGVRADMFAESKKNSLKWVHSDWVAFLSGKQPTDPQFWQIVWDRSLSLPDSKDSVASRLCRRQVGKVFKLLGIDPAKGGIVVGHTVQKEITNFCQDKVFRIDVGLSEAFGENRPLSCLALDFPKPETILPIRTVVSMGPWVKILASGLVVTLLTTILASRHEKFKGSMSTLLPKANKKAVIMVLILVLMTAVYGVHKTWHDKILRVRYVAAEDNKVSPQDAEAGTVEVQVVTAPKYLAHSMLQEAQLKIRVHRQSRKASVEKGVAYFLKDKIRFPEVTSALKYTTGSVLPLAGILVAWQNAEEITNGISQLKSKAFSEIFDKTTSALHVSKNLNNLNKKPLVHYEEEKEEEKEEESTAVSESIYIDNNDYEKSQAVVHDETKTELESNPEAKPEVKPEAKPEVKPEAKPEVKPEAKPEVKPEAIPIVGKNKTNKITKNEKAATTAKKIKEKKEEAEAEANRETWLKEAAAKVIADQAAAKVIADQAAREKEKKAAKIVKVDAEKEAETIAIQKIDKINLEVSEALAKVQKQSNTMNNLYYSVTAASETYYRKQETAFAVLDKIQPPISNQKQEEISLLENAVLESFNYFIRKIQDAEKEKKAQTNIKTLESTVVSDVRLEANPKLQQKEADAKNHITEYKETAKHTASMREKQSKEAETLKILIIESANNDTMKLLDNIMKSIVTINENADIVTTSVQKAESDTQISTVKPGTSTVGMLKHESEQATQEAEAAERSLKNMKDSYNKAYPKYLKFGIYLKMFESNNLFIVGDQNIKEIIDDIKLGFISFDEKINKADQEVVRAREAASKKKETYQLELSKENKKFSEIYQQNKNKSIL